MAEIKIAADAGGGWTSLKGPANTSNQNAFVLPSADGSAGQYLKTDGSKNFSFGTPSGGKILQVVQTLNTTITDYSGSSSWRDISISQAITPAATSSKILIQGMVTVSGASPSGFSVGFQILRGSTVVPTAPSTDGQSSTFAMHVSGSNDDDCGTVSFSYIDSPSTTSATTYKFQALARDNAGFSINASNDHSDDTNANFRQRGQSTITLMEIAG